MSRVPPSARILAGMGLGVLAGLALGADAGRLGEVGAALIQLIKTLAAPLLFLAVLDAFLRSELKGASAARMLALSAINTLIALAVGLAVSNWLEPGRKLTLPSLKAASADSALLSPGKFDVWKTLAGYVPRSVVAPFAENSVITLILLAVLLGGALRRVKNEQLREGQSGYQAVESAVASLYRAVEVSLGWVIRFIPLAVFCVTAKTVGENGFAPIRGLAAYLGAALLGLSIQVLVVYQAWLLARRIPLRWFWRGVREPAAYALGASSSLATLPVTLRSLETMGVSRASARLSACVGTNFNNDGILLYEAMAALFVAQAYGIHLSVAQQAMAMVVCLFAGIGIAGIPDAGLISLSLVLSTVGLPLEILPLLLTVDWILSRARAVTNVIADILVAVVIDR